MENNKIRKETAMQYFEHLRDCRGFGTKEYEMKEAMQNDENFKLIEVEFKENIETLKSQLPEKRLKNLPEKIKECFREDRDEEFEEEDFDGDYEEVVNKLITDREYDDYDYQDIVFEQRLDSYGDDELTGDPNEIELDKVIETLEKIKLKYPGQKIFLNTVADGTMAVDRVRIHAISKKIKPLYDIYMTIYSLVKMELDSHERDISEFKKKQKELGL